LRNNEPEWAAAGSLASRTQVCDGKPLMYWTPKIASRCQLAIHRTASLWILLILLAWTGCATRQPASAPAARQSLPEAAATFDAAWDIINRTHYDTNFNGVNWRRVREELRPQAEAATSTEALRAVLEAMVHRLGQSHFGIIPSGPNLRATSPPPNISATNAPAPKPSPVATAEPERAAGDIGIELRLWKRQYLVSRAHTNSPAWQAGARPGWLLDKVNGVPAKSLAAGAKGYNRRHREEIAWAAMCELLKGAPGSRVELEFLDGQNRKVAITCERAPTAGAATKLGFLPTFYARLEKAHLRLSPNTRAGLIRFNIWMPSLSAALDQAIDEMRNEDGIIIDLRGNPGGQVTMVMGMSGHFLGDHYSLGALRTRDAVLHLTANPRLVDASGHSVPPFAGPVAILVDDCSFSASEIFAGGMQAIGRARVFGQSTAGMALPATVDTLPNGDRMVHAFGDFVAPNGTRWEGRGVIPDTATPRRRARLLAGHDDALEAAEAWIAAQKRHHTPPSPLAVIPPSAPTTNHLAAPATAPAARDASLPSAAEVLAKYVAACGGREALAKHHSMHFKGTVRLPAQGFNGQTEILQARPNKFLTRISFKSKLLDLRMTQGYDGKTGWMIDPTAGPMLMKGNSLSQLEDQADFEALFHDARLYQSMEITGQELFEGKPCYKMRSISKTGAESTEFFDVETGLIAGTISRQETILGSIPATTVLSDYRRFDGLLTPTRYTIKCIGFDIITVIESLEFDQVEDSVFALPPQIEGLLQKP
jgi:carboxyl-terminal processing protease